MKAKIVLQTILLTVVAVALGFGTLFLAPLPLLLIRRNFGRTLFAVSALFSCLALVLLTPAQTYLPFIFSVLLATVLSETENQGIGYSSATLVTVLVLAGAGVLFASFAAHFRGFEPVPFFRELISQSLAQMNLPTGMNVDKEVLLLQVPSALVMLIVFSVWVNSIFVRRIEKVLRWVPTEQKVFFAKYEFQAWKTPDYFVWFALLAVAGNFLVSQPVWLKWTATNIFNIAVMLYFFHGLAVVVSFFNRKAVTPIWRTIGYLFIFTQLFLAVAFLGFVDLWMNFRNKPKADSSAVA